MSKEKAYLNLTAPLPNDELLEQVVLGHIFLDNSIMTDIKTKLTANDFYYEKHKVIFNAMNILYKQDAKIDVATVANVLGDDIKKITVSYLTDLSIRENSIEGYKYIVEKVKEFSDRRNTAKELVLALNNMMNTQTDMGENILKINEIANDTLKTVNKGSYALNMEELLMKTEMELIENLKNGGKLKGRQSGIADLDNALGGFENELIVCGARPSMGKTSLIVNLLRGLAINHKCLFFSMEQKDTQLITKLLSQDTKIDNRKIDIGALDGQEQTKVFNAMKNLKDLNLKIDERAGIGINEIESAIIKEKQTNGLDVVCIDYLQYMDIGNTENSNYAFTKIVKKLKTLTKKYEICIILLSQLSRAPEQRADHHPIMSDLRDSGSIEQEADKIMLLYRDVYYNPDTEFKDILEINLAKNRNGAVKNNLMLGFDLTKQLIYSLSDEDKVDLIKKGSK